MTFDIRRGTNISHFLSQSAQRGREREQWFTEEDVWKLADAGLDHLRLPIDEDQMWTESGQREPEAWDLMNASLDWCKQAGLKAIVDLHILRSHHFVETASRTLFKDPAAAVKFADLWRDLSSGLRNRSVGDVAYELMNEPVADDPRDWNRVYMFPYRAIRELEPDRTIAIGSNLWSQPDTFDALEVPEADSNLILTFHYYHPILFTHYRASWVGECKEYAGPIRYPGTPIAPDDLLRLDRPIRDLVEKRNRHYDVSVMEADLAKPLAVMERTRLPLWCGEFGVFNTVPDMLRFAWYRDFVSVLDKHGIPWTNWDYKGGFGLFDRSGAPTTAFHALFTGYPAFAEGAPVPS